jgi:hypothetical protein
MFQLTFVQMFSKKMFRNRRALQSRLFSVVITRHAGLNRLMRIRWSVQGPLHHACAPASGGLGRRLRRLSSNNRKPIYTELPLHISSQLHFGPFISSPLMANRRPISFYTLCCHAISSSQSERERGTTQQPESHTHMQSVYRLLNSPAPIFLRVINCCRESLAREGGLMERERARLYMWVANSWSDYAVCHNETQEKLHGMIDL